MSDRPQEPRLSRVLTRPVEHRWPLFHEQRDASMQDHKCKRCGAWASESCRPDFTYPPCGERLTVLGWIVARTLVRVKGSVR